MTTQNDKPQPGKVYNLISGSGPCIASGNSWTESEVEGEKSPHVIKLDPLLDYYAQDLEATESDSTGHEYYRD
mgnify:CR=1 FL=1